MMFLEGCQIAGRTNADDDDDDNVDNDGDDDDAAPGIDNS